MITMVIMLFIPRTLHELPNTPLPERVDAWHNPILMAQPGYHGTRPVISPPRNPLLHHLSANQVPIVARDPREAPWQSPCLLAATVAFF
jgi:hypothetical protein